MKTPFSPRAGRLGVAVCVASGISIMVFSPSSASADSLNLGVAANYAVVDLASGKTLSQNSGPIAGNELLGNGVKAAFSGGANQPIGTIYYDPTVLGTNTFSQFQPAPTTVALADTTLTQQALTSANNVGSYAATLAPTQVFSNNIAGDGGLNVIDVTNIQNVAFTISGNANDIFVFNVSGSFQTNVAMTLSGVNASRILFNFTGTSGNVFQTSGGDTVYGTFLATDGGNFQFSNLNLTGALINTAGDVSIVSGSGIPTFTPFTPPSAVPLPGVFPSTLLLLGGVLGASTLRAARRRSAAV